MPVLGRSPVQCGGDVFELPNQGAYFGGGHLAGGRLSPELALDSLSVAFYLGDPGAYCADVRLLFEQRPVLRKLCVAFLELTTEVEFPVGVDVWREVARVGQRFARGLKV